ncbi:MAG: hypothetical protein NC084_09440 [Bacteroides sp.]|nr:hypothetical protein [Eubacterium sp.]MCM1417494.1 hypothetical protein [Roseburia sp.]MCM1462920.1 hypothetical protein [Bacteroides sp.]
MKKLLSLLTAIAMIASIASCSNETVETTTTTTPAETTLAPEEDEAPAGLAGLADSSDEEAPEETESSEETEAPEETEGATVDENAEPIEIVRANAPIYANYIEEQTILPICVGFAYDTDLYGTGVASHCEMTTIIKSANEMAVITAADGVEQDIIITGDRYYMVSPDEKTALYLDIDDEMRASLEESMTTGLDNSIQFDAAAATYETGTEEFNGAEYLYEKIVAPEVEVTLYADPATKDVRYLISAGITMEVTDFTHDIPDDIFTIPADYALVSMEDALDAQ